MDIYHSNQGKQITTDQGVPVTDNLNSLKMGNRGPILLEDFIYREKMFRFDHERIPERIVHARGFGVHGYFENYESLEEITSADLFQRKGEKTPVFVRFSTVAGNKGSPDLPRDVRGFAVKFYTKEGNWDIVGNNIPVFFIQDPIQFPDLIHSAKQEPDRGFPQAATAHDTFWDFISLTPESMHMVMWAMSDRAIPRSFRTMEGFGVHSFRLVTKEGKSTYVKFHWKPKLGLQSVIWDEAVKINGADSDFHRKDLWNSIQAGDFPEWELGFQLFDDAFADKFEFDILDPTKIIPEELIPIRKVGRLVLNKTVDNFFNETEQVAFCTQNIVPGIDFTNDPLLQGRNFSYLDTQLKRLGGPNFTQIPINRPRGCPFANFNQDGHMNLYNPKGRVNYFPNTLDPNTPKDGNATGNRAFKSFPAKEESNIKIRQRNPDRFADHYSQARQFFISQTANEQDHIANALIFELSNVDTLHIRKKMVGHLLNIDSGLAKKVKEGLGIKEDIQPEAPKRKPIELPPSKALSIIKNSGHSFKGRKLGILVTDGVEDSILVALQNQIKEQGATFEIVGLTMEGTITKNGTKLPADKKLEGGPSVIFDAVVVIASAEGVKLLDKRPAAKQFINDAFVHFKFMGYSSQVKPLLEKIGLLNDLDNGCFELSNADAVPNFVKALNNIRFWERENKISYGV